MIKCNISNKFLQYYYRTPKEVAKRSGLGEVFKAIKRQNCDVFKCSKKLH